MSVIYFTYKKTQVFIPRNSQNDRVIYAPATTKVAAKCCWLWAFS